MMGGPIIHRHHRRPRARGGQGGGGGGGGAARPRRDALGVAGVLKEFPVGQLKLNLKLRLICSFFSLDCVSSLTGWRVTQPRKKPSAGE